MLYNKNWDAKTVTSDPFTLESLIAWLEKQPADQGYEWHNCDGGCLIGLYGAYHGFSWRQMIDCPGGDPENTPYAKLTPGGLAAAHPRTFGAALIRARAALAAR